MHHFLGIGVVLLSGLASSFGLAQDQFLDSNGTRIRYQDRGQGPPIIFLHGFTVSLDTWIDSGVLPNLERDYRVIAFDARGHGKSEKPHGPEDYGVEMGLDAIRLLDHLQIKKAHFVGYSMGAQIVAQLATTHADRMLTATLGGGAGRFDWTEADSAQYELEAAEKEEFCISKSMIVRLWPAGQPSPSEQELKRLSDACMADPNTDRFAQAALLRGLQNQSITTEQAAAVDVPTLGIVGSLDPILKDFHTLKRLRPDLKLVVVEGATHSGSNATYRRPDFVTALRELLSSQ